MDKVTLTFLNDDEIVYETKCSVAENDDAHSDNLVFFKKRSFEKANSDVIFVDANKKVTKNFDKAKFFVRVPKSIVPLIKKSEVKIFKQTEASPTEPIVESKKEEPVVEVPPSEPITKEFPLIEPVKEPTEAEKALTELRKKKIELIGKWMDTAIWPE